MLNKVPEWKVFSEHYEGWRKTRLDKVKQIFGDEFFNEKTLLEIGCGYAHIGRHFHDLGAVVTATDGRPEHIDKVKMRHPMIESFVSDVNGRWNLNRKFDVLINFGVLYHLVDWKNHLKSCMQHSDLMVFETEVANRSSKDFEFKRNENIMKYDQSIHGAGVRPSAANIENHFESLGLKYKRYDDEDLNSEPHRYDWKVNDYAPEWTVSHRRFWVVTK